METKNKIYIISAIFGLVVLVLVIFFVLPSFKKIKKSSEDLFSEKNNIILLENQLNGVENFKKNYNNYKTDLEKIDLLFVDLKNPVNFIESLEKIAFDSNINLEISPSSSKKEPENSVVFRLFAEGDFPDIIRFSEKLESGPYLTKIQDLTIKKAERKLEDKSSKKYSSGKVEANFSIDVLVK